MEEERLVRELIQGKEWANLLQIHLKDPSSLESNRLLIAEILGSIENAISILRSHDSSVGETKPRVSLSPKSEISEVDSKNVFRKRKTSEKVTEKVKICISPGQNTPPDDGYCWRKYGQKDILGSTNPRGYYRCTHRYSQECLATKQVQRSDSDSLMFEVSYIGHHTCNVVPEVVPQQTRTGANKVQEKGLEKCKKKRPRTSQTDSILNLDGDEKAIFRTFSFSSIPNMEPEILSASPATSGSDYLSLTWCSNVQTPISEITHEFGSPAATSVANSPIQIDDFDFNTLEDFDFDASFLGYF